MGRPRATPRVVRTLRTVALLLAAAITACTGRSYPRPDSPRYAGPSAAEPRPRADTLRIVSFNVRFAQEIDSAIAVLATDPALRGADVVLLQEMDADGTRRIAEALGMAWVYYPAIWRRPTRRDFGNAVLSRWPIEEDAKLVLPHVSRYARTRRIATAATLRIGGPAGDTTRVRVYATHLGTVLDVGSGARRDQLRAILADAARWPRVILGGDMNSEEVGRVARAAGYAWPTEHIVPTTPFGQRLDHVFLRGLVPVAGAVGPVAGVVTAHRQASDHYPIWTLAVLGVER